jgi:iron(III) transport system substrate-binding protein
MNPPYRRLVPLLCICLVVSLTFGCRRSREREVVVYTSVDQPFSEPVFRDFEKTTGVRVRAVFETEVPKSARVIDRLVSESQRPQADVFWSGDTLGPLLLIRRDQVTAYAPAQADAIPSEYRSSQGMWTATTARAAVLLVNRNRVPIDRIPQSIKHLADERWKGQTAMASPLHGTTAMLVATLFASWGEARAKAFLDELKSNRVRIVSTNDEVARLVIHGEVAFGLVDTDDAHEAAQEASHVTTVYPDQDGEGTVLMPTTIVMLRGAPHPDTARQLIDYLASAEVEQHMADQAAHIPLRAGIPVPASVRPLSQIRAMKIDYERVATEMERIQPLLHAWTNAP